MAVKRAARAPKQRNVQPQRIRARLREAEATLDAIRTGQVDALVVSGPRGERTLTIDGVTHPYFVLLNAMSDGAVLLEAGGGILFGNQTFGAIAGVPVGRLRGSMFQRLIVAADRSGFDGFLREGAAQHVTREFTLTTGNGSATPVAIALSALSLEPTPANAESRVHADTPMLMAIITDLTYRRTAEATHGQLLERLMSAEDDERRRIARELHDETGQSLTALLVGLRTIADVDGHPEVQFLALRLREVVVQTMDDLGRLARGLHPAVLDDMGLAAAARRYLADYSRSFGAALDFVVGDVDAPRLAPLTAATMYRILQETLTNASRHAHATAIAVELTRDESALELVVRDDGVGFKMGRSRGTSARLGLRGMRERVALLGGSIQIESKPGHGTTIHARVPASRPPPGGGGGGQKHSRTKS